MLVACCQLAPRIGDLEGNRARALRAIEAAALRGARIVLVPELASSGYVFDDPAEARALAEPADGPTLAGWAEVAGELDVVVVGGFAEIDEEGILRNSAALVDPTGVRAVYRKAHLWDRESLFFTPGEDPPPVVETDRGRIGVMVCYDQEFPEWVRVAALAGAQLLAVPSNWPAAPDVLDGLSSAGLLAQANACANRMYVAVCDRHGIERDVDWVGGSMIAAPDGTRLDGPPADHGEAIVLADCDLSAADDKGISERNDVLADRRPELYGSIAAARQPAAIAPPH